MRKFLQIKEVNMKNLKVKLLILAVGAFFTAGLFLSVNSTDAQTQTPPVIKAPPPLGTPTPEVPIVDDDEIIIDTEVVNVLFTAQDKNRRLLTTLKQEDVKLFENGQPQEITYFARQVDLPLSLAILIDTSASQERTLPEEKEAAKVFLGFGCPSDKRRSGDHFVYRRNDARTGNDE